MAQAGKKTRWAEVTCPIHGKEDPDQKVNGWKPRQVEQSTAAVRAAEEAL